MECPACDGALTHHLTRQGVEIDYCEKCKGFWLDKGEIYHFTNYPKKLADDIKEGLKHPRPSGRKNPKTGCSLTEISLLNGRLVIDVCEETGGIWIDDGELEKLSDLPSKLLAIEIDRSVEDPVTTTRPVSKQMSRRPLARLPNLAFRSSMTIFFLYALMTLVLITIAEFTRLTPGGALLIGLVLLAFNFLLGPWLMDISLDLFYTIKWQNFDDLPGHLQKFVSDACRETNMKIPRFGVIDDGAPNAFTYGHTPNNARIVITRGIMELLEADEVEAVVAHEIGHAKNWDMFLMTVVQLVPLVLYFIYRTLIRLDLSSGKRAAGKAAAAVGAYVVYLISEYIVLWFSRTREYYADRFAGQVTRAPNSLAKALVKIAYGLAGQKVDKKQESERSGRMDAIGAMGIFDTDRSRSFAITSVSVQSQDQSASLDPANVAGAMKWDLWNPWAKYYELNSTHPLVANRLNHLGDLAEAVGQTPYIRFSERKPESYWDEFIFDILIMFLPFAAFVISVLASVALDEPGLIGAGISAAGILSIIKLYFTYPRDFFPEMSVSGLLKKVKVSAVRPVPCKLKGTIIGRGVPGLIWSEDFVLEDDTGIIFLDYRQPLRLWEFFFGLMRSYVIQNQEVEIEGWFRRAPVPYIEIKKLTYNGKVLKCYIPAFKAITAIAMIILGIAIIPAF